MDKLRELVYAKPVLTLSIIVAVFLIPIIIMATISASTTRVNIIVAPSDAELYLNGDSIEPGESRLRPGEYTLEASREGFADGSETFHIGEERTEIAILLQPVTEEAFAIVREEEEVFIAAEGALGLQTQLEGEKFRDENEILRHLPYRSMLFEIHYRAGDSNGIVLQIRAESQHRYDLAISQIENWGFDPGSLEIERID